MVGCSTREGGRAACCIDRIRRANRTCMASDTLACVVHPGSAAWLWNSPTTFTPTAVHGSSAVQTRPSEAEARTGAGEAVEAHNKMRGFGKTFVRSERKVRATMHGQKLRGSKGSAKPYAVSVPPSLTSSELKFCGALLANSSWTARPPAVVLTHMPRVEAPWLLGVSAALHGLPLAIAGFGHPVDQRWFDGKTPSLPSLLRAAQLLGAIPATAHVPVALLDAHDTFVANAPSAISHEIAHKMGEAQVTVGGECLHHPVCNIGEMRSRRADYRACVDEGFDACSPNSGLLYGHPKPLGTLLLAMLQRIVERQVESGPLAFISAHDQGALHTLYIEGGAAGVELEVDHMSRHILNLAPCNTRQNYTQAVKGFSYCRERYHLPFARTRVLNSTALYHYPRTTSPPVHPLFAHANSAYGGGVAATQLLRHHKLAPVREAFSAWPPPPHVLITPVLLMDSARFGACAVVPLGHIVNGTLEK